MGCDAMKLFCKLSVCPTWGQNLKAFNLLAKLIIKMFKPVSTIKQFLDLLTKQRTTLDQLNNPVNCLNYAICY